MASTGKKRSSGILKEFITARTQVWQYLNTSLDFFLRAAGLRTTTTLAGAISDGGFDSPCSISKCENESYILNGVTYDVWEHKGAAAIGSPDNPVIEVDPDPLNNVWGNVSFFGIINVSKGNMAIISDSSLMGAADSTFDTVDYTPLASEETLVTNVASGTTAFADVVYMSVYNDQAPIEQNEIIVSTTTSFEFESSLYVNFKFIVEQGAKVELVIS